MSPVAYDTSGPFAVITSDSPRLSRNLVNFQLPRTGQCSVAVVDTQLVTKYFVPHCNSKRLTGNGGCWRGASSPCSRGRCILREDCGSGFETADADAERPCCIRLIRLVRGRALESPSLTSR